MNFKFSEFRFTRGSGIKSLFVLALLFAFLGIAWGIYGISFGASTKALQIDEQFDRDMRFIHSELVKSFECVEKFLSHTASNLSPGDYSDSLFKEYSQGIAECSLLGGISMLTSDGKTWGVGKALANVRAIVTPIKNAKLSERYFTDMYGAPIDGSYKKISDPRISSLWPWVGKDGSNAIIWTAPYTSKVIDEPVISAVIRGKNNTVFSAHIRLSDLSFFLNRLKTPFIDSTIILDAYGRKLTYPVDVLLQNEANYDVPLLAPIDGGSPFYNAFQTWYGLQWPENFDFRVNLDGLDKNVGKVYTIKINSQTLGLFALSPKNQNSTLMMQWVVGSGVFILLAVLVLTFKRLRY